MATASLPSGSNIRELRLAIEVAADDVTRPLNRKRPFAAPYRELWTGQILFRPMTRAELDALLAALEALEGRSLPFKVELKAGKFSRVSTPTTCTVVSAVRGSSTIGLNLGSSGATVKRGTLITVGNIDAGDFQLFEVVEDVTASPSATVRVAPRVRHAFSAGTAGTVGAVFAKLKLAESKADAQADLSSGIVAISVVEAL